MVRNILPVASSYQNLQLLPYPNKSQLHYKTRHERNTIDFFSKKMRGGTFWPIRLRVFAPPAPPWFEQSNNHRSTATGRAGMGILAKVGRNNFSFRRVLLRHGYEVLENKTNTRKSPKPPFTEDYNHHRRGSMQGGGGGRGDPSAPDRQGIAANLSTTEGHD